MILLSPAEPVREMLTSVYGVVEFSDVARERARVQVGAEDYETAYNVPVEADATEVLVALSPAMQITGTVVGPPGRGVRAYVKAVPLVEGAVEGSGYTFETDNLGEFGVALPPGSYRISTRVFSGEHAGFRAEQVVSARSDELLLSLVQDPDMVPTKIEVRTESDDPISYGTLKVSAGEDEFEAAIVDGMVRVAVRRNVDAVLEVFDPWQTRRIPQFGAERVGPLRLTGTIVRVVVRPPRSVTGRISGPDGGVGGIRVLARDLSEDPPHPWQTGGVVTEADGRFTLTGLGSIPMRVFTLPVGDYVAPDAVVLDDRTVSIELALRRGRRARVQVRDERGDPVARHYVSAIHSAPLHRVKPHTSRTGPDGFADLTGLADDVTYRLQVSNADGVEVLTKPNWRPEDTVVTLGE